MDWARDRLGNLTHASERSLFSYRLECPTCGEPVHRRAGLQRRAHFAHFSHRAKPECENYHPPLSTSQQRLRGSQLNQSVLSIQGGLFLQRRDRGKYSLGLKLPRLLEGPETSGEIEIRSALGVRTYSQAQLRRRHLVPLVPQIPLLEVSGTKEVAEAVYAIGRDVSFFRERDNYFRESHAGGRLLGPSEPLEWGERYQVLSQQPLQSLPAGLLLERQTEASGWYFYEVELPAVESVDRDKIREAIERFVGRAVEARRPHVYVIDPPPHHIELDGTCVFPIGIDRIVLAQTASCQISIDEQLSVASSWIIRETGPEWWDVTGPGMGEFVVLVDGRYEVGVRFEECDLFQPGGVRLVVGDRELEIFESEGRDEIDQNGQLPVHIKCPASRVADQLILDGDAWIRDASTFTLRQPVSQPSVAARNFGRLRWPSKEGARATQVPSDHQIDPQRIWIEGLLSLSPELVADLSTGRGQYGARGSNFALRGLLPHIRSVFGGRN